MDEAEASNFEAIWQVDRKNEFKNRTWWWWWWLFFFKNKEHPEKTKQLMVLWATRNAKRAKIDGNVWELEKPMEIGETSASFDGVVSAWYWDGEKMIDPLYFDKGRLTSSWGKKGTHKVSLKNDNTYSFQGKPGEYTFNASNPDVKIALKMTPWTDWMGPVIPTGKKYVGNLSYAMHKIRGMNVAGTVAVGEKKEKLAGTTYFQKVRINSPTSPWYWAVLHGEKGAFMDYFMPHLGVSMFRSKHSHKSILDRGGKMLSTGFQFYYPKTDTMYKMKNIRMRKKYVDDNPIFILTGREDGAALYLEMTCYARACKHIEQPFLGLFKTALFYNEYPCHVSNFKYRNGDLTVSLKDLGRVWGNCEHAWGIV